LFTGFSSSLAADAATIIGEVIKNNGRPVIRAVVKIGDEFTYTDVQGRFRLKNIPFGKHTLTISKKGQLLKTRTIEIDKPKINLSEKVDEL